MEPVRILHVVTYMGRGGLETMLMNYYRHIDRSKIQFDFLVHRDFEADYDKEIKEMGGRIYHLPRLNPFSLSYRKKLDQFFKEHKEYKVVHVHQDCLSSIALKIAKKNKVPVRIAHSHNANQEKNIKYLIKKYYMRSIPKYATRLFACGEDAGNWMFNGASYHVMNNAIDTEMFRYDETVRSCMRKELKISEDTMLIGHVGRFHPQKNHDFLIDVFYEIHKKILNSKLILIGSGNLEDEIREKVDSRNLENDVLFMGNCSNVNELMQAMDIFVFPSLYEGLPVTLIEAQSSGLLIIKSDNVPNQCDVTSNVYSLSLDIDLELWADKIIEVNKSFQRKNTSKNIVESGYDITSNAKWLEDFYLNEVSKYE